MSTLTKYYRRRNVWMILFFKSEMKKAETLSERWTSLADKMYGVLTVAAIDCRIHDVLCEEEFQVFEYPRIFCAPANIDVQPIRYKGKIKVGPVASFGVKHMENFSQIVTSSNYDRFTHE